VSIRPHNLTTVEKTLMEAPKSLCVNSSFLSIFLNESVKNAQVDESYKYVGLKYKTYTLSLTGHFGVKFHKC